MSAKQKKYSAEFKTKVVLDLLSGDLTLGQVCAKYSVTNKSILAWKKMFLANASLAFSPDKIASDYQAAIAKKDKEVSELHRQLGKRTAELEWASKKLKSLDFDQKKHLVEFELDNTCIVPVSKRCALLGFNRSSYYYQESQGPEDKSGLLKAIDSIYSEMPFYGYRKIHQQLVENGHDVGINRVNLYMKELGLKAICPMKKISTTLANIKHKKYPYLLRDLDIAYANQVWSTDITYIKLDGGFVFLAAIIDWYSKAVLSWKISNTMDSSLVMHVLNEALANYGKPEIFNTDQGCQYTCNEHTQLLIDHGIQISMDGKGRATDNIAIERFWRSAKYENIYLYQYDSLPELKKSMVHYIDFYNHKRFHQSLNYQKPMNVYTNSLQGGYLKAA